MSSKFTFVFGVIIGLVFRWLFDQVYGQARSQHMPGSANNSQRERDPLEAELVSSRKTIQSLRKKVSQLESAREKQDDRSEPARQAAGSNASPLPAETESTFTQGLETESAPPASPKPVVPDRLVEIKGIGKVIAGLLNQNGIYTFEQLAAQTPDSLRVILGEVINRLTDEADLIEQARLLALQKQNKPASES